MKRRNIIASFFTTIFLLAAIPVMAATNKEIVEQGMYKEQVQKILGKPVYHSFDENTDVWEYWKKGPFLDNNRHIIVSFDKNGKVVSYRDFVDNSNAVTPNGNYRRHHGLTSDAHGCLNEEEFKYLYERVKSASFSDGKLAMVEVASLRCFFTCRQTAEIMKIFMSSEDRLKALSSMAAHIVDRENENEIYEALAFLSDHDKAKEILLRN